MEALFVFIVKSSSLLVLFYGAYYFLLHKETFFDSSRWFLLAGLVTSVVLPFVVYTKIVWIEPAPIQHVNSVANYSKVYIPHAIENESFQINWNYILLAVYAIGFLALLVKFAIDFYSLNSVLKGKKIQQEADFKFVDINENIAPFSYFDYIVYNSSMFTASELENIIEHEKVHSDQKHSVDVLISRVFCVLFWFNPIIWLYKKAILQNLEFIADSEAAKKISDKKAYQYTLLKITTHENCVAITNHFYQSLIKKRIVMLNKNQSKKRNYWKYCAVIPALIAFVLLFQINTIAQEKERKEVTEKESQIDIYKIKKTTTDQELKEIAEKVKKNHNVDVVISNVKRNSNKELTAIKVDIKKGSGEAQTIEIDGDKAIESCGIVISTQNNGSKKIVLVTDGAIDKPITIANHVVQDTEYKGQDMVNPPVPPTPPSTSSLPPAPIAPVAPVLPKELMIPPPPDMTKMPTPPVAPKNYEDKVAMKNFEKKMKEFDQKMSVYEPQMNAYQKQVDEIMAKRGLGYDKEMEKYGIEMDEFGVEMEKYTAEVEKQFGPDFEKKMKQFEKDMKVFEKNMREHQKDFKRAERESKKS